MPPHLREDDSGAAPAFRPRCPSSQPTWWTARRDRRPEKGHARQVALAWFWRQKPWIAPIPGRRSWTARGKLGARPSTHVRHLSDINAGRRADPSARRPLPRTPQKTSAAEHAELMPQKHKKHKINYSESTGMIFFCVFCFCGK